MADDVNQQEELPEIQAGEQSSPEAGEPGEEVPAEGGDTGTENPEVEENDESAAAGTRLARLEQDVTVKESEIAALKQAKDKLEEKLAAAGSSLAEAVTGYRAMVIQANPEVIEELIGGDTVESINESLRQAKALVSRVRQGVEAEIASARVPAGAPERAQPDLSALSPSEKIHYAMGGFSSRNR